MAIVKRENGFFSVKILKFEGVKIIKLHYFPLFFVGIRNKMIF